jgi:hypothetical protein
VLLGLLLGAVVGLWPFQEGVAPQLGEVFDGAVVTAERIAEIDPEDWPLRFFRPDTGQLAGSLLLIALGLAATLAIDRLGRLTAGEESATEGG